MHLHQVVRGFAPLGVSLLDLPLFVIPASIPHVAIPLLGIGLSMSGVTMSRDVARSHGGMLGHDSEIGALLELRAVVADLLLLSDDSDAFASIESLVGNLHLERQLFHLGEIEVLHLHELGNLFHRVLKGNFSIRRHVSDLSGHQSLLL